MGVLRRRGAALVAVGALLLLAAMPSSGAVPEPPAPGTYLGNGFDACSAPSSSTMDAWLASPYRAVGVYVGGVNRACAQPELTATWVAHQEASGWHLLPIYLGLQASCTTSGKQYLIDPTQAAAQGRSEATSAVAAATGLGLPRGSTLFFDMEAYQTGNAACATEVLRFLGAWTSRLHDLGHLSGVYSSLGDGNASTDNDTIPAGYWSAHRRLHQYRGGHDESYGGVGINIDNDYVDVRPLPGAGFGDFTGNGWSDLLARDRSTGTLYLYPGNGANLEARVSLGAGRFGSAIRYGDFDRDGHEDVIARDRSTGYLWLYPGTGARLGRRIRLGTGWNAMREITAVGDLTGDGHPDLISRQDGRPAAPGPALRRLVRPRPAALTDAGRPREPVARPVPTAGRPG